MIITSKEVSLFTSLSIRTAHDKIREVRRQVGKKPYCKITAKEYCDYYQINLNYFITYVNSRGKMGSD